MKEMRMLGNMVDKLAADKKCAPTDLCEIIGCSLEQYSLFLNGRMFLSFEQLKNTAQFFGITIASLLNGDDEHYEKSIVHCMGDFENPENREDVLDIIDDYLNLISVAK